MASEEDSASARLLPARRAAGGCRLAASAGVVALPAPRRSSAPDGVVLLRHRLLSFVLGLRRPGPTSSPGGRPELRSASRAACRMRTAAAWSTTERCRRPSTPLSRRLRWASTVVSRSSTRRTGTGAMRTDSRPAYVRAASRRHLPHRRASGADRPRPRRPRARARWRRPPRGRRRRPPAPPPRRGPPCAPASRACRRGRWRRRRRARRRRRCRRAPAVLRAGRHQPASSPTRHSTAARASPTFGRVRCRRPGRGRPCRRRRRRAPGPPAARARRP